MRVVRVAACLALAASAACTGPVAPNAGECRVELPVYGPTGERLKGFRVTKVTFAEPEGQHIDLLNKSFDTFRLTSSGETLIFSTKRVMGRRPLLVWMAGPKKEIVSERVYVTQCPQRQSVTYGELDDGSDVSGILLKGRVSGCRMDGDWWIRSVSMFGSDPSGLSRDGYIQPDGAFELSLRAQGVRHLLVVGHGNSPVKTVAVDVTSGKVNDVGAIDVSGGCAGQGRR